MKKRFLTIAIAAGMAASFSASAGNATVFGNAHITLDSFNSGAPGASTNEMEMNSQTSSIGVKGKEDMGGGMTALFFLEWQVDIANVNKGDGAAGTNTTALSDRNQWVGIKKAGMGTLRLGTVTSNYKATGSKVDPMWRTSVEARNSSINMMSSQYHGGGADDRGRMSNAIQFASAPIAGMQMVINSGVSGDNADSTIGAGVRYKTKDLFAFVDWMDRAGISSAAKVGATYKMGKVKLGFQHEMAGDAIGEDITFLSVKYSLSSNDWVAVNFASASMEASSSAATKDDGSGYALMYNHNLSKRTNAYAGYGSEDIDDNNNDEERLTLGLRHKF